MTGWPPPFNTLSRDMPTVLTIVDVLIDRAAVPDEGGAARAAAWAMRTSRSGCATSVSGPSAARAVLGKLLADLTPELMHVARTVGRDPREIVDRYLGRDDPLARLPSVARARGILHGRLRNATQRWEANDLIDIVNLSCAAGYADVVVGERQNISYLRQARNVPPGALLATSLAEGVALLKRG